MKFKLTYNAQPHREFPCVAHVYEQENENSFKFICCGVGRTYPEAKEEALITLRAKLAAPEIPEPEEVEV